MVSPAPKIQNNKMLNYIEYSANSAELSNQELKIPNSNQVEARRLKRADRYNQSKREKLQQIKLVLLQQIKFGILELNRSHYKNYNFLEIKQLVVSSNPTTSIYPRSQTKPNQTKPVFLCGDIFSILVDKNENRFL